MISRNARTDLLQPGRYRVPRRIGLFTIALALAPVMSAGLANSANTQGSACLGIEDSSTNEPPSVHSITRKGGLIYLFGRQEQLQQPFACADYYIAHGLDIDARDPRSGHPPLTALTYAIRQNDPRLTKFVIQRGASLEKPAGHENLKPMAYAYRLAMKYTSVDRNAVIAVLNDAL